MSLDIKSNLYYHNGHLFWSETIHNKCQKDSPAGTKKQNGYIEIQYKHKRYYAHRIIWEMLVGSIPEGHVINHIDGNPSNNLISNLECVTHVENLHAFRKLTNNTSGIRGVSWCKLTNCWDAALTFKGTRYRMKCSSLKEAEHFLMETRKALVELNSPEGGK